MKIKDFVAEYNKSDNKNELIKKHITETYIGYLTKTYTAEKICKAALYKEVEINGEKVVRYSPNTAAVHMLFDKAVVDLYTDLEFDEEVLTDYDLLLQSGIMSKLYNIDDVKSLRDMLDNVISDVNGKEESFVQYFKSEQEKLGILVNEISDELKEVLEKEKAQG